ncbi:F-box-like protein [Cinnamomum micranthum f. kanehirae]|uniref:F-box-like protein n=1 Tax=Cinnamomum micranthum f. kanehirae TaxID=337451 RepID=A0A443PKK0_9MAGN|nr:F-box-like protein [Cinnamomum micranthum f. kanehirae]
MERIQKTSGYCSFAAKYCFSLALFSWRRKGRMGPSVSSSEGSFCYLTNDLLMDILSRLPPKSLVACKSVSKTFHRLVSTIIHSPTVPRPFSGLFIVEVDPTQGTMESFEYFNLKINGADLDDESLSFLPCDPDTRIIDCRGGLLLCASTNSNSVEEDECYVCNPVTKQWVALPPPPKHGFSSNYKFDVNLALVLDESSDVFVSHYKVFLFVTLNGENLKSELDVNVESSKDGNEEPLTDLYVHVYSSKTGQWVESNGYSIGISFRLLEKRAEFLNGALLLPADPSLFLKFDVEEEYIEVMNLPTYSDTQQFIPSICLGESQGCLNYAYHNGSKMEVWMGENSEWVVKHRINLDDVEFPEPLEDPVFFEDPIIEEPLDILAFHPTKDAIFLRNQGVFLCYDFTNGAFDIVMRYDYGATISMCYWVFSFSECLRSLANAHPRS